MSSHKISLVQDSPVFLDKDATVSKACLLIEDAAASGAKLIVFPEGFIPAYPDWVWVIPAGKKPILNTLYNRLLENSVSIPDDATKKLCAAAKKNKIWVVMGISERNSEASNASLYNTLLYINDKGEVAGKHRKLVPTGGERLVWAQGNEAGFEAHETPFGRLGGLICWENYMPLARYATYKNGVQVFIAATWDSGEVWQAGMRHLAREGGMYVISCCMALGMEDIPDEFEFKTQYAAGKEWINPGNSMIINPNGDIIAGPLHRQKGLLFADIELDKVASAKWILDTAGHYDRTDLFNFSIRD